MNVKELILEGNLLETRALFSLEVKAAPADPDARLLLFQLLCFLGEWDKAERHLDILLLKPSPQRAPALLLYKNLVKAEKARLEVETGGMPDFLTEPPPFTRKFLEARCALLAGESAPFKTLVNEIDDIIAEPSGVADGVPFYGFSDCDIFGSWYLEAFIHDRYLWFPFSSIRELTISPPELLLDLLWIPATVVTWGGMTTDCYLPVLYPGTFREEDDQVRLGKMTDWLELPGGYCRGVGQHLMAVGNEEKGLLELRTVAFSRPKVEAPS